MGYSSRKWHRYIFFDFYLTQLFVAHLFWNHLIALQMVKESEE